MPTNSHIDCPHRVGGKCQLLIDRGYPNAFSDHTCHRCLAERASGFDATLTPAMIEIISRVEAAKAEQQNANYMAVNPIKRSRGLGDIVAASLAAIGVKRRPGCGCARRQALLNILGQKIGFEKLSKIFSKSI